MNTLQKETQKLIGKYIIIFTLVLEITEVYGEDILISAFEIKDGQKWQGIKLDTSKNIYNDELCQSMYYDGTTKLIITN